MSFAAVTKPLGLNQKPTYHVAPNFRTKPPPEGPYKLGSVVDDLKTFDLVLRNPVPVPMELQKTDVEDNPQLKVRGHSGKAANILTRVLDFVLGIDAMFRDTNDTAELYKMESVETVSFHPDTAYINDCVKLPAVIDHFTASSFATPIYLVTGLKIARGFTRSWSTNRYTGGGADVGVRGSAGNIDLQATAGARAFDSAAVEEPAADPRDIVLGLRVWKIYNRRAALLGDPKLKAVKEVKGATLLGSGGGAETTEFIIGDMEDDDGFEKVTDDESGETWYLPVKQDA